MNVLDSNNSLSGGRCEVGRGVLARGALLIEPALYARNTVFCVVFEGHRYMWGTWRARCGLCAAASHVLWCAPARAVGAQQAFAAARQWRRWQCCDTLCTQLRAWLPARRCHMTCPHEAAAPPHETAHTPLHPCSCTSGHRALGTPLQARRVPDAVAARGAFTRGIRIKHCRRTRDRCSLSVGARNPRARAQHSA